MYQQKHFFPHCQLCLNLEGTRGFFDNPSLHLIPHVLCPYFSGRLICTGCREWVILMSTAVMHAEGGTVNIDMLLITGLTVLSTWSDWLFYKTLRAKYCYVLHYTNKTLSPQRFSVLSKSTELVGGGTRLCTQAVGCKVCAFDHNRMFLLVSTSLSPHCCSSVEIVVDDMIMGIVYVRLFLLAFQ